MPQENVELMRLLYEAFGRGDVETVLGSMDEGIEWHEAENFLYADRSPYVGPQAVLEGVFARLGEDWEFFEVQPHFAHVWGLRDGKVTSFHQYTDTKGFSDAVAS